MSIMLNLIPIVSEKANRELETHRRYTFLINPKLNKKQILNEIQKLFNVDVLKVRTMIYRPNVKKKNTRSGLKIGKTNKLKKIIITIKEGQEIDVYGSI